MANFDGLNYFPENPALRLEVQAEKTEGNKEMQVQTSTGEFEVYQRWGRFRFQVDGQPAELTILFSDMGYFLPFVDSLAGKETYPAGRYLEPKPLGGGRFRIDFNLA